MSVTYRLKRRDGSIREGLTANDLLSLGKIGEIRRSDFIAKGGTDNWTPAGMVKGLVVTEDLERCAAISGSARQNNLMARGGWREIIHECRAFVPLIESSAGQGSGLLISHNGLIVTNRHVVEGAGVLRVTLSDGTKAKALVLHRDHRLDLAVIRAAMRGRAFYRLPERVSTGCEAGDEVIAIGHPHGLTFTSTQGIISEPRRHLMDQEFVQTDVAINPGNSGGPLLDLEGRLVGLNTLIERDSQGIGFAIPGDHVVTYLADFEQRVRFGKVCIPSDEEVNLEEEELSPRELLLATLKTTGLTYEVDNDGNVIIATPGGERFIACVDNDLFFLFHHIADLTAEQEDDPVLPYQMLRWQSKLPLVRFEIHNDNSLALAISRSAMDLDMSEIRSSLLRMCDALDSVSGMLRAYLLG